MEIAKANNSHIPEIMDVWEEFALFHEDMDPRYPMVENVRSGFRKYIRGLLADRDTLVLVALNEKSVVGYSVAQIRKSSPAFRRKKYGFIDAMAVKTECRRQGVGTLMLSEILDWFRSHNIDMIEMDVATGNQLGYAFWEKHGFKDYQRRLYLKT